MRLSKSEKMPTVRTGPLLPRGLEEAEIQYLSRLESSRANRRCQDSLLMELSYEILSGRTWGRPRGRSVDSKPSR